MGEAKNKELQARADRRLHVIGLCATAASLDLDGVDFIQALDGDTLVREYNGIGPEWAGAPIRAKVTKYLALFEPAALIHDLRNYKSDGSRSNFNYANLEFLANCLKIANATYPWYSWRLYRARAVAYALFDFVSGPGGWKAWIDCYERNQTLKQQ